VVLLSALAELAERRGPALAADVASSAPSHWERGRGVNQAQAGLISKILARRLGLPGKASATDEGAAGAEQAGP